MIVSPKCVCGRGSTLYPAAGAHSALPAPSWIRGGRGRERTGGKRSGRVRRERNGGTSKLEAWLRAYGLEDDSSAKESSWKCSRCHNGWIERKSARRQLANSLYAGGAIIRSETFHC